jgi:hypothetical protein
VSEYSERLHEASLVDDDLEQFENTVIEQQQPERSRSDYLSPDDAWQWETVVGRATVDMRSVHAVRVSVNHRCCEAKGSVARRAARGPRLANGLCRGRAADPSATGLQHHERSVNIFLGLL